MSGTDEELKAIRKAFGAWILVEIAAHDMDRAAFIQRVEFGKSTVSRWINGEALPTPGALFMIAHVLRIPPDVVLAHAAGKDAGAPGTPSPRLPPNLSKGEARLLEHLAWGVRHWREEQNAARDPGDEGVA